MKKLNRLCIYPKDVHVITGRSLAYSRTMLKELRFKLGKGRNGFVTIEEFCRYTGLNYEEVREMIDN